MSISADHMRLRRLFFLLLGLSLILQLPGELAHATPLQTTSVSISMSNPTCVQALPTSGACSIRLGSLIASGSAPTFSRLEVLVNGKLRVYMGGFFESSAYLSDSMAPGGLTVACGRTNEGGLPNYGRSYLLTANAYMVDGASASDSMTIFCPAYNGQTDLPLIKK